MEATTMDTAAQASAPVAEKPASEGTSFSPVVKAGEFLRWIWWFDIGAVALAGGQAVRLVKAIVDKGKEVEPAVIKPFKKAESTVSEALEEVGSRLKAVKPAGPTEASLADEVRELSTKVVELAQRVEGLHEKKASGNTEEDNTLAFKAAQE